MTPASREDGDTSWEWHRDWIPAISLTAFSILLRVLVATQRQGIEIDGIIYLQNAQALLKNWESINVLHPPLYSVLLAPFIGLWSDVEFGSRVVSAVLGGLWVVPTLWLARETTTESVAWTSGLLVALTPAAVEVSTKVLSEATFGLFLTLFFFCLVRTLRTGSTLATTFTGVFGGLSTLARPEGMGYLFLSGGLLLIARPGFAFLWTWRRTLAQLAVLTFCWIVVISPYVLMIRVQTGQWHWSGKANISLLFAESVGDERQGSFGERHLSDLHEADIPKSLIGYVIARPSPVLQRLIINLHLLDKYTLPSLLASGGLALLVLGLTRLRLCRSSHPEWVLLTFPLPLAGFLLYLLNTRYFVALLPAISIIAGIGLARFKQPASPRGPCQLSKISLFAFIIVLFSFTPYIIRPWFREDPNAIEKTAGIWLRNTVGAHAAFVGSYPVLGYYLDAPNVAFGVRSLEALIATGRRMGARFLIADNYRLPESRPDLLALASGNRTVHTDLELLHVIEDRAGRRILIYRIL